MAILNNSMTNELDLGDVYNRFSNSSDIYSGVPICTCIEGIRCNLHGLLIEPSPAHNIMGQNIYISPISRPSHLYNQLELNRLTCMGHILPMDNIDKTIQDEKVRKIEVTQQKKQKPIENKPNMQHMYLTRKNTREIKKDNYSMYTNDHLLTNIDSTYNNRDTSMLLNNNNLLDNNIMGNASPIGNNNDLSTSKVNNNLFNNTVTLPVIEHDREKRMVSLFLRVDNALASSLTKEACPDDTEGPYIECLGNDIWGVLYRYSAQRYGIKLAHRLAGRKATALGARKLIQNGVVIDIEDEAIEQPVADKRRRRLVQIGEGPVEPPVAGSYTDATFDAAKRCIIIRWLAAGGQGCFRRFSTQRFGIRPAQRMAAEFYKQLTNTEMPALDFTNKKGKKKMGHWTKRKHL